MADELHRIIMLRAPEEAVGLILEGGRVIELPNKSETPGNHFEVHKDDVIKALGTESDSSAIIFWHSHPSGGIGPSRTDMKHKSPFPYHLVLTLLQGEMVPSWY